jgi:hypothetical protein
MPAAKAVPKTPSDVKSFRCREMGEMELHIHQILHSHAISPAI